MITAFLVLLGLYAALLWFTEPGEWLRYIVADWWRSR